MGASAIRCPFVCANGQGPQPDRSPLWGPQPEGATRYANDRNDTNDTVGVIPCMTKPRHPLAYALACWLLSAAVMATAIAYFHQSGSTLYSGDAEAHLNIARRIVDSRTPGWSQIGTTWLPLPHLLMIPLVRNDWMWITGLAGAIVSGVSMTIAVAFLFAAVHRIFSNTAAAISAVAVFLLNPNALY